MSIRNSLLRTYFARRMKAIDRFRRHPTKCRPRCSDSSLRGGRYGVRSSARCCQASYARGVRRTGRSAGLREFQALYRADAGRREECRSPGAGDAARSSGTTSDRSKFIPVTRESVWWNHTLGMRDVAAVYASAKPQTKIFDGKTLTLGGSYVRENGALIGDLSAVLISQTPFWSGWFRAPKMETALIPDFDRKIEGICRECTREKITAFAGVPSWNLVLMRRVLEYTGKSNLLEVWPDLEFLRTGAWRLRPTASRSPSWIPSEGMTYLETYNASRVFSRWPTI